MKHNFSDKMDGILAQRASSGSMDVAIENSLKAQFIVAKERRAQFYLPDSKPIKLGSDPKYVKLERVSSSLIKSSPIWGELGLEDEDATKMSWIAVGTLKNLRSDAPLDEKAQCIANNICVTNMKKLGAPPKIVEDFTNAAQQEKPEIFNTFLYTKIGQRKDYYEETFKLAMSIAVIYGLFANPSDANVRYLQEKHSGSLSMVVPYLSYLFTEKERRGRAQLAKLIEEYEKREGFA